MYSVKIPGIVKAWYTGLTWNFNRTSSNVFLTFDDGPHSQITDEVLSFLAQAQARATFFCVGNNVQKYRDVFQRVKQAGHSVGNHTFNHVNGWKTRNYAYYRNIVKCKQQVNSNLFRPPYGRITRTQSKAVKNKFNIIMWDVLSRDFDKNVSKEKCLDNVVRYIQPGSIVVFHDSEKASEKMLYALPRVLEYIQEKKWNAVEIPMTPKLKV